MTPCEEIGLKVGDTVELMEQFYGYPAGTHITLIHDDTTTTPSFQYECGQLYTPLSRVKPIAYSAERAVAKRFNADKVDYTLVPTDALTEEAKVWMAGEKKYGRDNWQKLWGSDTVAVVLASLLRHAYAIQSGESHDAETGFQHAAHIRCNAAMLVRYFNNKLDPSSHP
jgi:hypothetical protein